jgi:hypothetical protein
MTSQPIAPDVGHLVFFADETDKSGHITGMSQKRAYVRTNHAFRVYPLSPENWHYIGTSPTFSKHMWRFTP